MKKCLVCGRRAEGRFRGRHQQAYDSPRGGYGRWKRALGSISWKEYLEEVFRNEYSGRWVIWEHYEAAVESLAL